MLKKSYIKNITKDNGLQDQNIYALANHYETLLAFPKQTYDSYYQINDFNVEATVLIIDNKINSDSIIGAITDKNSRAWIATNNKLAELK